MIGIALLLFLGIARADPVPPEAAVLIAAYPDAQLGFEDGAIRWRDGTRMPWNSGLDAQMSLAYPAGRTFTEPPIADPGRTRYAPFFEKLYGATAREVESELERVPWIRGSGQPPVRVTKRNGVALALRRVVRALELLPAKLQRCARTHAGGYAARAIAGTREKSPHAYGIAVDVGASTCGDYWRWSSPSTPKYKNRMPLEIVEVFEANGFIWGGKWSAFDTMHFEYRPELLRR